LPDFPVKRACLNEGEAVYPWLLHHIYNKIYDI